MIDCRHRKLVLALLAVAASTSALFLRPTLASEGQDRSRDALLCSATERQLVPHPAAVDQKDLLAAVRPPVDDAGGSWSLVTDCRWGSGEVAADCPARGGAGPP